MGLKSFLGGIFGSSPPEPRRSVEDYASWDEISPPRDRAPGVIIIEPSRPTPAPASEEPARDRPIAEHPWERSSYTTAPAEPSRTLWVPSTWSGGTGAKKKKKKKKSDSEESKPTFVAQPRILSELKNTPNAVLIPTTKGDDYTVVDGAKLEDSLRNAKDAASPPDWTVLRHLKETNGPTIAVPRVDSSVLRRIVPYAIILPSGFDASRQGKYRIELAITPHEKTVDEVVGTLKKNGTPNRPDIVTIVAGAPDVGLATHVEKTRSMVETEILDLLAKDFNVDFSRYSVLELGAAPDDWRAAIERGGRPKRLDGPVVSVGGEWRQEPPTRNHQRKFPEPEKFAATEVIPHSLQKQPPDQGAFFAPVIKSSAMDSRVRMGVYLPPGYDPDAQDRYPVLMLLPGKGNPLSHWTTAGQIIPKLNRMMSGDAQKMIVVIAENTDSFWFDYDKNGDGKMGSRGKRDFEGHIIDELLRYATENLKGDPKKISVGGISRGGFGAMSLAFRHPGRFASVSSHSGVLAFNHQGGILDGLASMVAKEHFGGPDNPVWEKFTPADLVRAGALADRPPRLYFDIGLEDQWFLSDNLSFADLLEKKGIAHTFHVVEADNRKVEHNWDTWEPLLESWIAFHQSAHGRPGVIRLPAHLKDVAKEALDEHRQRIEKRYLEVGELMKTVPARAHEIEARAKELMGKIGDVGPFELLGGASDELEAMIGSLRRIEREAAALKNAKDLPLHVAEAHAEGIRAQLKRAESLCDDVQKGIQKQWIGERPRPIVPDHASIGKLSAADQRDIAYVIEHVPESRNALAMIATARPQVFGKEDRVTRQRFAQQLKTFIEQGILTEADVPGFVEYLRRIAIRRFDWRRPGYSHSVCSSMNSVYNHPGVILTLIAAARTEKKVMLPELYGGSGPEGLRPMGDFMAGFKPVDAMRDLPESQLGYERGLLRAIVDELSPMRLSADRFAKTCDPVAVAQSRLFGQEVRYGYAFKFKTGADLVEALETQNGEGLAFADIRIRMKGRGEFDLHFPVFYDYDPKTRTVAMQEWVRGEQRLKVDDLEFLVHDRAGGPAMYYRDDPKIWKFLTPWEQKNWGAIKDAWKGPRPPEPVKKSDEGKRSDDPKKSDPGRRWESERDWAFDV